MNCVCGNKLTKIKTEMDFFDGEVIVRNVDAFYCSNCKEELFDSKQGNNLFEKISKLNKPELFNSRKKISQMGNSLAVPLSKEISEFINAKKGNEINIKVINSKRLIIDFA